MEDRPVQMADVSGIPIAYRLKSGGRDAIVFIHGLGGSMDSFLPAFSLEEFQGYTLAALDLPGCGGTGSPEDFSYSMGDQAELVVKWLEFLGIESAAIVGHSMGGVIGLIAAETLSPKRVKTFINLEGNLSFEDCTFSAKIAAWSTDEFVARGYEKFLHDLEEEAATSPSPGLKEFYTNIKRAYPPGLYRSALSLVAESKGGDLMARFAGLGTKKCYVFGERSLIPASKSFLQAEDIPFRVISSAGHFMMDDSAGEFYEMLFTELQ